MSAPSRWSARPKPPGSENRTASHATRRWIGLIAAIATAASRYALANEYGIADGTFNRLVRRKGDLMLASADKIANYVGFKVVRPSKATLDTAPQTLSDGLHSAIADSGLSTRSLANGSGVDWQTIRRFVLRKGDMKLASADKLFNVLAIKVVREAKAPGSEKRDGPPTRPITDGLIAAIADSGLGARSLANGSGVAVGPSAGSSAARVT